MGEVANLNYNILINDKDVEAIIERIEKRAQQMNVTLSEAFSIEAMQKNVADMATYKAIIEGLKKRVEELASANSEMAEKMAKANAEAAELARDTANKQQDASERSRAAMSAESAYRLQNAQAMEKENSYRKIGNELVKEASERSRQLASDFSYLAEAERMEENARKAADAEKAKEIASFSTKLKETIALYQKMASIETSLKVRQVSKPDSVLSASEARLLNQYKEQYAELRKEIDRLTAKYPQLKRVFDQTFNTANMRLAVDAERQIARETEKVTREKERQNKHTATAIRNAQRLTEKAKEATVETGKVTKYVHQIQNMLGGAVSVYAMKRILQNLIEITGEFELQRTTLRAIIQDANKADVIFEKIKSLAIESPFNFKELISYTKQLSAFSIPVNELYDTTKMLADLSAGLGVGMDRLILFYGQVRSASFLRGQEVRQATEAGIPLLEALRQEFERLGETGITVGQVFDKISARQVSFEMVRKVLTDMTEEGGRFYNMQEVQAETLKGKLSNLTDAFQMMMNDIGQSQSDILKGAVDWLRELMKNYEQAGRNILSLVAAYGACKVMITGIIAIQKAHNAALVANTAINAANHASLVGNITTGNMLVRSIGKQLSSLRIIRALGNPYAIAASGAAALGLAIYKSITYQTDYEKGLKRIRKAQEDYNGSTDADIAQMGVMIARLRSLTEGTDEYAKARNAILQKYDSYLTQQQKEEIATNGLAESYNILAAAIANANKEKYKIQLTGEFEEQRTDWQKDFMKRIRKELVDSGFSENLSSLVYGIITESITLDNIADEATRRQVESFLNSLEKTVIGPEQNTGQAAYYYNLAKQNADTYLNALKKEYDTKMSEIDSLVSNAMKDFDWIDPNALKKTEKELSEFYRRVQETLTNLGKDASYQWWVDDTKNSEYYEYLANIRGEWKEINERIKDAGNTQGAQLPKLKDELGTLEAIAKAIGIEINPTKEKGGTGRQENPYEKEIEALKLEYDLLKKIKSAYDLLSGAGYQDSAIDRLFSDTLGTRYRGLDFRTQAEVIISSLNGMGEAGKEAADAISNSVDKIDITDEARRMVDGLKNATDRLKKLYDEFDDYLLEGDGISFDFSKIIKDGRKAIIEIENERTRSLTDLETKRRIMEEEAYEREKADINRIYDLRLANERKLMSEKILNLSDNIISDQNSKSGLGLMLNNLQGKNIFQLGKLREALVQAKEDLDRYTLELTDQGMRSLIDRYGDNIPQKEIENLYADVDAAIRKAKAKREGEESVVNTEYMKEYAKVVGNVAGRVKDFASRMSELADVIGSTDLQSGMEALSGFADVVSAAAQGFAAGGWIGAVVGGVTELSNQLITGLTQARATMEATDRSIRNVADAIRRLETDNLLSGSDSIFGTNSISNVRNYQEALKNVAKEYDTLARQLSTDTDIIFGDSNDFKWYQGLGSGPTLWLTNLVDNWNGSADQMKRSISGIRDAISGLANMKIKTKDYNGFLEFFGARDEYSTLAALYPDLFDKDGKMDLDKLEEVYDSIKANDYMLTQEQEDFFENLLENYRQYTEAMDSISEYLSGIFSEVASTIADNMVEAFIASGNAAISFGEITSNVAKKMASDLIQSILFENVLDEYEAKIKGLFDSGAESYMEDAVRRTDVVMEMFTEAMDKVGQLAPEITEMLTGLSGYFYNADSSLKNSIQGITEETANRLANLINGMYAELFRQGVRIDLISENVAKILECAIGISSNTYQDYLMQIQANTYDTARNTARMLERIDSVMASTGGTGGSGIKVYLQ